MRACRSISNPLVVRAICAAKVGKRGTARRLTRWLLQALDLTDERELPLTQESIAKMLGVRRTSVTLIANRLQADGLIRYRRGHIVVLNRMGLEEVACECYHAIHRRTRREEERRPRRVAILHSDNMLTLENSVAPSIGAEE